MRELFDELSDIYFSFSEFLSEVNNDFYLKQSLVNVCNTTNKEKIVGLMMETS